MSELCYGNVEKSWVVMWTLSKAQTVWSDYSVPARISCGFVPAVSVKPSYLCHFFIFPQNTFLSHFTFIWPCIVTNFFVMKQTRCTNFTNLFCHETLHVSGQFVCPSSGVYSLYTQQWFMSYRFVDSFQAGRDGPARKLSTNLYDTYHCWVYGE